MNGQKKPILLVEDDESIRVTVQMLLESEDYLVLAAENGKIAIDRLREQEDNIALILLDWMMPVMNGQEFLAQLKKNPSHRLASIPVIILTASANITQAAKNAVDGFIKKPIEIEDFLRIISDIYHKRAA